MSPILHRPSFASVRSGASFVITNLSFTQKTFLLLAGLILLAPQLLLARSAEGSKQVALTITGNIPTGVATEAYTASVKASGGTAPYVYKAGSLPKGLTINHSTGAITGTSTSVGQFTFTIFATDTGTGHGQTDFTVTFNQPPVSISLAPGTLTLSSGGGQQFLATVQNTSNTSVTWTASAGTISSAGNYTAPKVTSNTSATITATSVADTTKTAKATVTVSTSTQPPVSLELLYPPTSPFQPYYADVQKYLLNNPLVAGVNFWLQWGDVDKGPNAIPQYDFSAFDAQIAPWIGAGKKVNVIVWAVSDTPVNNATPSYVFSNLGSSNITTCAGEKIPNYFQSAFQLPYQAFMAQVVKHFATNASIGYIRIGLARGGETWPAPNFGTDPCTNTFINKWGWTDTTWTNYVDAMLNYESTLKSPKPLQVGIDSYDSNSIPDSEAATAVTLHMGFGNQGLRASDITKYPHCSSDWCNLFDTYTGDVSLELQPIALSNPNGTGEVGSLVTLLPFAVSHHATILELYCYDWLLAFDPNYPQYSSYGAGYATAFKAASQGK
jgi:hypothetical protein